MAAPESRKEQRTALVESLRRDGLTWEQVADELRRHETASPLLALRWAHNLSQQQVADAYNALLTNDPDDKPIDFRRVCRWELWPHGGTMPPLPALNRLARIFQVRAAFLFDGADYRTLDPNHQAQPTSDPTHHDLPPTNPLLPTTLTGSVGPRHPQRPGQRPGDRTPILRPDQLATFDPRSPGRGMAGLNGEPQLLLLTGRTYMERRTVLEVIASIPGVTLLTGTNSLLDPEATEIIRHAVERPSKVGPEALGPLGELIMAYRHLDDTLGGSYVAEPVAGIVRMIDGLLLPAAAPAVRQPLFSLAASAAQLAGWIAIDGRNDGEAQGLYEQALEWATAADDTALIAYVWCCRADRARWSGDVSGAISAAEAARRAARPHDKSLRAWVEMRTGRAYARAGNADETVRAMEQATELLADTNSADVPGWLYHFRPEVLTAEHGCALADIGQGVKAAELLATALDRLPGSFVRDRGAYLANQANAFRVAGDVRQACLTATEAILIGQQTGSVRTVKIVSNLYQALDGAAAKLPEAQELGGLLREDATS